MMTPSFHFSTTRPTLPAQTTIVFVNDYWAHWSESNEDALAYLAKIYADEVDFYGKQVSRHKLMDEKRRFAERWPERVYTARPTSISTHCDADSATCTVTGVVDWDCRSAARRAKSIRVANFTFRLTLTTNRVAIVGESGSVIHRE
jgi:hypothetical protein